MYSLCTSVSHTDKKVKRGDLLGALAGGGAPPSAEQAGYQGQVQTGLTGLGLGQLGGPVNGVLGTAGGLEAGVQGTLNGLGLGAVNGVARSALGTVNGLEDSVQGTIKGLGLPEPVGSTVGNVITTAKGVQGQALSQLNVVPQGSNNGDAAGQALPDLQGQLNGLGLAGLTGVAGGVLAPVNGVQGQLQGQLSGLGLGAIGNAVPNLNAQGLPKLDPAILSNILSTPNGIAALNNLTPAQLSSLDLGPLTNAVSSPLSAVDGVQSQLQGLGLGGATSALGGATGALGGATGALGGATNALGGATGVLGGAGGSLGAATGALEGLTGNLPVSGLASADPASALHLPQSPLGALSDPQAVQNLLLSQAQEIAQLEKLVKEQNQRLASTAAGAGVPVSWPNPPTDQVRAALANNGLGDTAQVPGVFNQGLYNNKMAVPQGESKAEEEPPQEGESAPSSEAGPVPAVEATTALPVDVAEATASVAESASLPITPTPAAVLGQDGTFDPKNGKVFANVNPSRTATWIQTTSGWPWPVDASHLPPPIPAFTSWGVKMAGISDQTGAPTMSAMSAIPPPASAYTSWGIRTVGYREDGLRDPRNTALVDMFAPEPSATTPDREPMPSPTGAHGETSSENSNRPEKRSKKEEGGDEVPGYENQSGTALNPMVPDVSSYLHDYVSSYQVPDSPGSFHSAYSSPGTPVPDNPAKAIPSVSGGAEGPQLVLGDSKAPLSTQDKRSNSVPHVKEPKEPQEPDDNVDNEPAADSLAKRIDRSREGKDGTLKKREDEEEEHEDDPAEDNSENMPKAEPQAEAEPEEDPVTISPTPDTPVPLPKTLPAQPALHSKAHRVHKKDDGHHSTGNEEHRRSESTAYASPGGRPAMRRQKAYTPDLRHDHEKDATVRVHYSGHNGAHHHKRDEGHGEEPELPSAPVADPAGASQNGDVQKSGDYVGSHAQISPDCWEAMAAGKHMEHTQKRPAKLRRRNAMPDMANAASGQSVFVA